MTQTSRNGYLTKLLELAVIVILVLVPFQGILPVWLNSFLDHYTLLRLWPEFLLVILVFASVFLVCRDKKLQKILKHSWLNWLIISYILLHILVGLVSLARHEVDFTALGYALIVNLRLVVFFWVCWVIANQTGLGERNRRKIILIPAAVVVIFGLLQHYVLPTDFLRHFGYGPSTILPYQTVDQNNQFVRIQSTLRGSNPLGAYLVIVVSALTIWLIKVKGHAKKVLIAVSGLATVIVLYSTYSRSAWLGTVLAVGLSVWMVLLKRVGRWLAASLVVVLIVIASVSWLHLRHNVRFEDTILHTSSQTRSPRSSNQNHESDVVSGLRDIEHQPLGRGPGTAGPASVYNNHPARISENYFIQLGQEVGILGIGIFIAINIIIARDLWYKRDNLLASILLYSLVGLTLVNMFSHAWTDDTLAYIWWGLAGIALSPGILKAKELKDHETQKVSKKKTL